MHGVFDKLARGFAILGGCVLSGLIILTCLSIAGRSLNTILHGEFVQSIAPGAANALLGLGVGPITGDFELVEAGMAFTIFAFLPLCQLRGSHASVDIFTAKLPERVNQMLHMVIEFAFAAALILIAWQLFLGLLSKKSAGQTTFLLELPLWWAYAASLAGAVAAAIIGVYVALARLVAMITGKRLLPPDAEAEH
ncbi:TRAP transporter small permease [Yoonia sp.]|uniref:TRAP transporter small permease n=1 Tax=Yoonia sp. TaxID=2212373 RepID=UPI003F6BC1E5